MTRRRFSPRFASSVSRTAVPTEVPARRLLTDQSVLVGFVAAHAVLGALIYVAPIVTTIHFWATAIFVVWFASTTRRPSDLAILAGYVVGAEVLWRMSSAAIFWETGKYALVALFVSGLVRFPHSKPMRGPALYFALLIPGIVLLIPGSDDLNEIRNRASFNLSGPLALAVSACFFRQWPLNKREFGEILVAVIGPAAAIAVVTAGYTFGTANIAFTGNSNFETTGGFGPNQVSAALSMGVLLSYLLLASHQSFGFRCRVILFGTMVICAAQSAMTFSRAGLYMASASIVAASLFLIRERASRRIVVGTLVAMVAVAGVVAPQLVEYTGGALADRFQDSSSTGRVDISKDDIRIWSEQPIFGVGVGQVKSNRVDRAKAAHTEWTRMLAEHGAFGMAAIVVLLAILAGSVLGARGSLEKAMVVALVVWGAAFLTVNDMRIAAPSFMIGLACATFQLTERRAWAPRRGRSMRAGVSA